MGKSPGKWMKTLLFGKKSSKSNLSKDVSLDKKTSITLTSQPNDLGADSASDDELIRLEHAATKAQAAFRGYLARRAFWALKGIIRLQAVIRGHLVRRQAVATLYSMRAIVELQAVVRGQIVKRSGSFPQVQKRTPEEHLEQVDLLQTSIKSEKLSTNTFAVKLVTSIKTKMPLRIQYDPTESNSVTNWLSRWSTSHFWDPLPPSKKIKKRTKLSKKPKTLDNSLNMESNGKENEKTRRRKSLPVKQQEQNHVPSYMAATESVKAKLRAQAAATVAEDGGESGSFRRHSLPSSTMTTTGNVGLQSPRVQKPLQVNVKGGSKSNKSQVSPRDGKFLFFLIAIIIYIYTSCYPRNAAGHE
ncbi:hypothetical protein LXL04_006251 [Taraxacum kok-saghyz]